MKPPPGPTRIVRPAPRTPRPSRLSAATEPSPRAAHAATELPPRYL